MENETTSPEPKEPILDQEPILDEVTDLEGVGTEAAPEGDGGAPVEEDILGLFLQMKKLTEERDQLQDQVYRTMADFQNFRKRKMEQEAQIKLLATEKLVRDLLPVVDNFARTVQAADAGATIEAITDGVRAVARQLNSALEGQQVSRIEPLGEAFDPEFHEALGIEVTDAVPEGHVAIVLESGYKMGDRLIRPARVKVAGKA
ncbi:MAG: nucleotide exchange factor GrpE [Fimbriimonas sp.]